MRIIASLIATVVALTISGPAFAADTIMIKGTLLPAGFCTQAEDGSVGVKLNGVSYDAWLALYALANQGEIYNDLVKFFGGNTLQASQELANMKKAAHRYQRVNISRAQNGKCS